MDCWLITFYFSYSDLNIKVNIPVRTFSAVAYMAWWCSDYVWVLQRLFLFLLESLLNVWMSWTEFSIISFFNVLNVLDGKINTYSL